jgi:uncharacterized membrane protein YgcG
MLRRIHRTSLLLAGICWLAVNGPVGAAPPAIKDEAHVFSPHVKDQAEKELEEIGRLYNKEVIIELVPSVPEGGWWNRLKKWMLYSKDPKSRKRFYEDWAKRNARAAGAKSIYILIVKEPSPLHLEIAAGRDAQKKDGLTPADCRRLQEQLQASFQKGQYDASLEETIRDLRRTLRDNRDAAIIPAEEFPWAEVGSFIGIMLGLWLCLQLMQKFLRNRDREQVVSLEKGGYGEGGSYLAGLYGTLTSHGLQELFHSLRSRAHPARDPVVSAFGPAVEDHEVVRKEGVFHETPLEHHAGEAQDYIHDNP